jgi:hypothetical protein
MTVACWEGHMDGMRKESLTALILVAHGAGIASRTENRNACQDDLAVDSTWSLGQVRYD